MRSESSNLFKRFLKWSGTVLFLLVLFCVPRLTASAQIIRLTMTVGETRTLYPGRDDSNFATRAVTGGTWISQGYEFVMVTSSPYQRSWCTVEAKKEFSSYVVVQLSYSYMIGRGILMQDSVDYLIKVEPHKHTWGSWTTVTQPTCKSTGRRKRVCESCSQTQYETLSALGHSLVRVAGKAPTKTAAGNIEYWKCSNCGRYYKDSGARSEVTQQDTVLAPVKTSSDAKNGSTSSGAKTDTSSSGAKTGSSSSTAVKKGQKYTVGKNIYKVTSAGTKSGTVSFTGTSGTKKSLTSLSVPSTVKIKGKSYKVTSIGNKAFKGCIKLKKVTIGNNVSSIGSECFSGCTSLASVKIGTGIKTVSAKAFYNCKNLKKLTIKSGNLKKVGKNAIRYIHKKAVIDVPAKSVKAYTRLFKESGGYKKTMKVK